MANISTLGGRNIYPWYPTKSYSGPPMKVFEGDPSKNKSKAAIDIATFNKINRGDPRTKKIENENKYFYNKETIKRDQAFADGKKEDPVTGQPNKGWIFRKYASNVDRSSPYIIQNAGEQPESPISPGDVKKGNEPNVQMILQNLTSSLNLDEISPARAAEEVITYLVGPIQRTVEDASSQLSQWENQAYNAFGVPNTGQGFIRDLLTAQIYALATKAIYEATSIDKEQSTPKDAAARSSLIRLALLRDKEFRHKVNDIVNRIIYQVTEVFNDGFDLITGIFPVVGDVAGVIKDVIQQGTATAQQITDGLDAAASVSGIIEATNQAIPQDQDSTKGGGQKEMTGGGKNKFIQENFENEIFDLFTKKYIERSNECQIQKGGSGNSNEILNNLVSKMVSQPLSHVTASKDWSIILSDTSKRISSVIDNEIPGYNESNKIGGFTEKKKMKNKTKKKGVLLKYKNKNGKFTKSIKVYN